MGVCRAVFLSSDFRFKRPTFHTSEGRTMLRTSLRLPRGLSRSGEQRSYPELSFSPYPGGVGKGEELKSRPRFRFDSTITRKLKTWIFLREKVVEKREV